MRQRDAKHNPKLPGAFCGDAAEDQRRLIARTGSHLDVERTEDRQPERLGGGFFGAKSCCEMLAWTSEALRVRALIRREQALCQARAPF